MRVLFITNIPSPYRVDFFSALGKFCDLTVVYELEKATNRNVTWKGEKKDTYKEIVLPTVQLISDGGVSFQIFKYLDESYDVIVIGTHGTPTAKLAMLYMSLRRIPFLLNIDGMLSADVGQKGRLNRLLRTVLFGLAPAYLVSGKETQRYLGALSSRLLKRPIYRYHFSSVHLDEVLEKTVSEEKKQKLKQGFHITEKQLILSVSRFIPKKGLDNLITAFSDLKQDDVALVLIGGKEEVYEAQLSQLPLNVRRRIYFPGFFEKKALLQWYMSADLFVLPTHHDEWGLVINEAMACGLPIVTTNLCGAGLEIICDGVNGYVYSHDDVHALRDSIGRILSNREMCETMAENNLECIKKYTIEQMVDDHLKVFTAIREEAGG